MTNPAFRRYLESIARNGQLTPEGLDVALHRLGVYPRGADWCRFADRFLLFAGTLLLLAGVVFFFAFNWNGLHRFVKMALLAVPLIYSAGMSVRYGLVRLSGKIWLGAAVVLTGVLLAVIGQIYQTGADSELLFAGWAMLTLPWVIVGCAAWLWMFWLTLVNVALALFILGRFDFWTVFFFSDAMFWLPLILNALVLFLWEVGWPRIDWMRINYAPRFVVLLAASAATGIGVSWWFLDTHADWRLMRYSPLMYLPWFVATLWFYSERRRDIVPLAVVALSGITVLTAGLIKGLFENHSFDIGSFFVIGVAVAAMTAGAAVWLRQTAGNWEKAERANDA